MCMKRLVSVTVLLFFLCTLGAGSPESIGTPDAVSGP